MARRKKGKHPERALSAMKLRAVLDAGRYADGNGLYLVVDPSGAKRWLPLSSTTGLFLSTTKVE
jgi:hypothetical protein